MADRTQKGGSYRPSFRADSIGAPVRGLGKVSKKPGVDQVKAPHTEVETHTDDLSAEMMARNYAQSVGFDNLATNPDIVMRAQYATKENRRSLFHHLEYLRNKWLILYRLYRGESINEFSYGRLQQHSPEPFKAVETAHPRIMRALFGHKSWFRLTGHQQEDDKNAKAQQALCRAQLRECRFEEEAEKFVRSGLIFGTAIQKTFWKQETREIKYRRAKKVPHDRLSTATKVELEEVQSEELVYDGNVVKNVEIFDYMISPSANSVDDAEWCADRMLLSGPKVQQMGEMGHWVNLAPLEDRAGRNDPTFGDEFKERKSYAYGVFDPREAAETPHIPFYEVEDWYIPLDVKVRDGHYETKLCNVVVVDPGGLHLIVRITELPFWHGQKPYQAWRPIAIHNEFYGIGQIEMIARLSRELDQKRNLYMAATQLEANPMWLVSDEANVPDGQFTIQPGHIIRVPSIENSVAPLHVPKVSNSALEAEQNLIRDIRETAGTTSPSMGAAAPTGGSKTATQHTNEIDQTNIRVANMVKNYDLMVTQPMIDQMTFNNQQFQSYPRTVREHGAIGAGFTDRYLVSPQDLIGRFLVEPLASFHVTTKQMQVQQLVNMFDRAPTVNQMYGPNVVDMPKLMAYIMQQGFDIQNVDEFIQLDDEDRLLVSVQEQEMWYQGNVPPVRKSDNHLRHFMDHMEELGTERFAQLEQEDMALAAKIRAHIAETAMKIFKTKDRQEREIMTAMQEAIRQNIIPPGIDGTRMQGEGLGGGMAAEGFGSPDQDPGSPNFRQNETDRQATGTEQNTDANIGASNFNPGSQ